MSEDFLGSPEDQRILPLKQLNTFEERGFTEIRVHREFPFHHPTADSDAHFNTGFCVESEIG